MEIEIFSHHGAENETVAVESVERTFFDGLSQRRGTFLLAGQTWQVVHLH